MPAIDIEYARDGAIQVRYQGKWVALPAGTAGQILVCQGEDLPVWRNLTLDDIPTIYPWNVVALMRFMRQMGFVDRDEREQYPLGLDADLNKVQV